MITAQQAPPSISRHSALLEASTTASRTNQSATFVSNQYKKIKVTIVKIEFPIEENKFARSQPTAPMVPGGGGRSGCEPGAYVCLSAIKTPYLSTNLTELLYQFMPIDMDNEIARYIPITINIVSISRPVWLSVMPPSVATRSI